jgi:integrase
MVFSNKCFKKFKAVIYRCTLTLFSNFDTFPFNVSQLLDFFSLPLSAEILRNDHLPPKRFSLHYLQHTFATLLLQENPENVDVRVIQERLGHVSLSTTSMYTHVEFEQKKRAFDRLVFK